MKCEGCGAHVPAENENRVCAFQVDVNTSDPEYTNAITCNCCDNCRNKCHNGLFENQKEDKTMNEEKYICPCCGGDGKETCTNPDHGFIDAIGGEIQRLGCPVCGHDPNHKVKNGGKCDTCDGTGKVNMERFNCFCNETGYDNEPVKVKEDKQ